MMEYIVSGQKLWWFLSCLQMKCEKGIIYKNKRKIERQQGLVESEPFEEIVMYVKTFVFSVKL